MILAVVLTFVFIIIEMLDTNRIKRNNKQKSMGWCIKANYRFNNHCDMKN